MPPFLARYSRAITRSAPLATVLLLGCVFPGQAQSPASGSSGERLESLVAAEQVALDANDPARILSSARDLASLGLQLLGSLSFQHNDCASASASYRQALALEDSPEHRQQQVELNLLLLTSELCQNHAEAAATISAHILALAGDTPDIHLTLANTRHTAGDLPGVIDELTRAVTLNPQLGQTHLALGSAYWELNEYQYNAESLREFTLAQQLLPANFLANENLGSVLSQYERYEAAAPYLQHAAEQDPASPSPWLQLGMNAYAQRQAPQAVTALLKAVSLTGANEALNGYQIRRVYAALNRLMVEQNRADEATQWAQREQKLRDVMAASAAPGPLTESTGLTTDPAHTAPPAASPHKAGPAAPDTSAKPQAPQSPQSPESPQSPQSSEDRALAQNLRQIVAKSLNDAGTVLARSHDYAGALPFFQQAAAADSAQSPVMRNLGLAAFHTGNCQLAISAFTQALQQNPADTLAQNDLAQCQATSPAPSALPRP